METNTFYLVWSPDTGYVRRQHQSEKEARDEAKRLVLKEHGREFYILKAITGMRVDIPVQIQELDELEELPF